MSPFPNPFLNPTVFGAISSTIVLASATPSFAAATQVVGVEVTTASNGVELHLKTTGGGDRPQVFAIPRGNSWVADVTNTQLKLATGTQFTQQNPAEGIRSITVAPLDTNSVRITVTGSNQTPDAQLTSRANNTLTFGIVPEAENEAAPSPNATSPAPETIAQRPASSSPTNEPEVLFPNPEITITDNSTSTEIPVPRQNPAPAFLPRAVAPPLGDIAVSNLIPNIGDNIDLGTAQRVPRLVLRDAPAREVLSLLARAAGLNLAYIGASAATPTTGGGNTGDTGATTVAAAGSEGPSITLDIENEPVQDVFNYVLKLTQLEAVRQGRTILVGPELPQDTRNTIIRSLRINQASAQTVAGFLSAQGAETQRVVTKTTRTEEGTGVDKRIQEETTTTIEPLAASTSSTGAPLTLQGLSIVTDDRLNSVTLIGEPSLVELATSLTRQLDLRQRQVAVNVKVIDVTLDNNSSFTSSFSFGIGDDAFISSDAGNAAVNFGELDPAGAGFSGVDGPVSRPVIDNPYLNVPVGINFDQFSNVPSAPGQGIQIINSSTGQIVGEIPTSGGIYSGSSFLTSNGLQTVQTAAPGGGFQTIQDITQGAPGSLRFTDTNANGVFDPADTVVGFTPAVLSSILPELPSVIQYPSDLLLRLRAQIVSQNAKILTDPTLIIQESQTATVNLTAKTLTDVTETTTTSTTGIPTVSRTFTYEDVGLLLSVAVARIDDNGFITLEVQPRVSVPGAPVTLNLTSGNQIVNQVEKRELNSGKIRLRDGQSLVLAGIIQENDTESITKWPILGDIPIIGALFRGTTGTKSRNEVIIVVTPQIMDDSDNSTFGYGYTPSPEVQQVLDRPNQ